MFLWLENPCLERAQRGRDVLAGISECMGLGDLALYFSGVDVKQPEHQASTGVRSVWKSLFQSVDKIDVASRPQ